MIFNFRTATRARSEFTAEHCPSVVDVESLGYLNDRANTREREVYDSIVKRDRYLIEYFQRSHLTCNIYKRNVCIDVFIYFLLNSSLFN